MAQRKFACGLLAIGCVIAVFMANVNGASAGRALKIFNILTNRGWSFEANFGLGFGYQEISTEKDFGPFIITKDPPSDPDPPPPLVRQFFNALFGG